jgi:hypothetical protein
MVICVLMSLLLITSINSLSQACRSLWWNVANGQSTICLNVKSLDAAAPNASIGRAVPAPRGQTR